MWLQVSDSLARCETQVMTQSEYLDGPDAEKPRIIVVDDDDAIRFALGMLVESFGWQIETYSSAEAFIEDYRPGERDCLVLDLQMPGMTGSDLLELLAERKSSLPAIVISAFADDSLVSRACRAGARAILRKPFRDDALLEAVRMALAPFA